LITAQNLVVVIMYVHVGGPKILGDDGTPHTWGSVADTRETRYSPHLLHQMSSLCVKPFGRR